MEPKKGTDSVKIGKIEAQMIEDGLERRCIIATRNVASLSNLSAVFRVIIKFQREEEK